MKKIIVFINLIFASFTILGQTNPVENVQFYTVENLNFDVFNDPNFKEYYNKTYDSKLFKENFFNPWTCNDKELIQEITSKLWDEYFTYNDISKRSPCYSGNYQPYTDSFIKQLTDNLPKRNGFPNTKEYAITTSTVDVRGLPTEEFCMKHIRNAGEGYPFDYLQYTTVWVGTPLLILSKTKDNLWYFVESPYSKGWVKSENIALVSNKQRKDLIKTNYVAIIKEGITLKGKAKSIKLNIGTILPLKGTSTSSKLLLPIKSNKNNSLAFETILIKENGFKRFPIEFNASNVKNILSELINGKYSWGGIHNGRDCSSTIKDYLTPFGVWMPRNSKPQSMSGETISLDGTITNKSEIIKKSGIPFLSTIYRPGHIMLFVGRNKDTTPLIFQTVWGLKAFYTDKNIIEISNNREKYGVFGVKKADSISNEVEGRLIIGKTVITSIEPEKDFNGLEKIKIDPFSKKFKTLTLITNKKQ